MAGPLVVFVHRLLGLLRLAVEWGESEYYGLAPNPHSSHCHGVIADLSTGRASLQDLCLALFQKNEEKHHLRRRRNGWILNTFDSDGSLVPIHGYWPRHAMGMTSNTPLRVSVIWTDFQHYWNLHLLGVF